MAAASLDGFLRQLGRAATADALAPFSDRQLIEQFLAGRDEAVFRAILGRHGPMVYRVCRRVLGDEHEAEDAFQAAFLVLARRAASIRTHTSLASWLHGVAHQVALRLRTSSRRRHQREARAARPDEALADDRSWAEVRAILDDELARLPESLRAPLVLCYLEGLTQDEAARQLDQTKSTFRRRLERGRDVLGARLIRRGVALSAVLSAVMVSDCAAAGVPPALLDSTTRVVTLTTEAVPPAILKLSTEVTRAMFLTKLRTGGLILTVLLTLGTAAGLMFAPRVGAEPAGPRTPIAASPAAPLAVPAVAPVPTPMSEFDKLCMLRDGEVLKRIAPPFPECRHDYLRKTGGFNPDGPFDPEDMRMVVTWDGKKAGRAFLRVSAKRVDGTPPPWYSVRHLTEYVTGISSFELEGDEKLLTAEAPGDFVVRDGATAEKVLPRLEAILRTECKLPVKMRVAEAEREVVVVRGKFASMPRMGRPKNEIDIFSTQPVPDSGAGGGSGDLARFLRGVEGFVGKRIVADVEKGPTGTLSWYFHARSPFTAEQQAEDHDPEKVFKTVAGQTGLEFKTEKRKVRVVIVEKAEK